MCLIKKYCRLPDLALGALVGRLASVPTSMLFEVAGMPELSAAVCASEARLIGMDEQVVVEAVLAREECVTDVALVGPETGVATQVAQQCRVGRELLVGPADSAPELVPRTARGLQCLDRIQSQSALLRLVVDQRVAPHARPDGGG